MTAGQQRGRWCSTLDLAVGSAGPLRGTEGPRDEDEASGQTRLRNIWAPSETPPPRQAATLGKHGFSESLKLEFVICLDEKSFGGPPGCGSTRLVNEMIG